MNNDLMAVARKGQHGPVCGRSHVSSSREARFRERVRLVLAISRPSRRIIIINSRDVEILQLSFSIPYLVLFYLENVTLAAM